MNKKRVIISMMVLILIIILGLWISGIIPKQLAKISATIYLKKNFPKIQLEFVDIEWSSAFNGYSIQFKDENNEIYGFIMNNKYFPITLGQGLFGFEEKYSERYENQEKASKTTSKGIRTELEENIDLDLQEEKFKEKIDNYISNIYFGLDTYITEFDNINLADEKWIWECTYKFLCKDNTFSSSIIISKENIETVAKKCFGSDLQKEFPKEGLEYWLEPKEDGYFLAVASTESDFHNDYEILSYKKNDKNIIVDIVEYKYNEIFLGEPTKLELYKINSDEVVKSYSLNISSATDIYNDFLLNKHNEAKIFVKENIGLFSTATITLEYDEQNDLLYIKSFER